MPILFNHYPPNILKKNNNVTNNLDPRRNFFVWNATNIFLIIQLHIFGDLNGSNKKHTKRKEIDKIPKEET